jgi:hypothetical protein
VVARIWSGDLSRVSVVIRIVVVMIVLRVIRRGRRFWMRRCPMSLPDSHSFAETRAADEVILAAFDIMPLSLQVADGYSYTKADMALIAVSALEEAGWLLVGPSPHEPADEGRTGHAHSDGSIADCDFCGAGPGDCDCGTQNDGDGSIGG